MRKLLIILMMFCVSLIQPNLHTVSASTEGIEIKEFVADITLLDTGDMVIREEWHMVYDEAFRVRFRDIGFDKFPDDYPLSYADTNRAYFNETEFYMIMFKDNVDITSSVRFATSLELERDELGEYIKCVPYSIYCESLFVDTGFRGGLQGDIVFVYSYRIDGAVSVYSDIAELNWIVFEYAESRVEKGSVTIHLPDNTNTIDSHYVFTNEIRNATSTITDNNEMSFEFTNLRSSEPLEFRLLVPPNLFPNIAAENIYISDDMNLQIILDYQANIERLAELNKTMNYVILAVVSLQVVVFIIAVRKKKNDLFKAYDIPLSSSYFTEPPRDYPAAMINRLFLFNKPSMKDITLTLLDLIERGYIHVDNANLSLENDPFEIENQAREVGFDKVDTLIELNEEQLKKREDQFYIEFHLNPEMNTQDLRTYETTLVTWFFEVIGNGHSVTTKAINEYGNGTTQVNEQVKYRNYARTFTDQLSSEVSKEHFIENSAHSKSKMQRLSLVPGIVLLFVLSTRIYSNPFLVVFGIVFLIFEMMMYVMYISSLKRRSKVAQTIYQRYKDYEKQLRNKEHIKELSIQDMEYVDHILVYAVLFDINDDVLQEIESTILQNSFTHNAQDNNNIRHSYYYHRAYRHEMNRTYKKSYRFTAPVSSSGSSSGRSGGGGHSSGGGGGGGRSR